MILFEVAAPLNGFVWKAFPGLSFDRGEIGGLYDPATNSKGLAERGAESEGIEIEDEGRILVWSPLKITPLFVK